MLEFNSRVALLGIDTASYALKKVTRAASGAQDAEMFETISVVYLAFLGMYSFMRAQSFVRRALFCA